MNRQNLQLALAVAIAVSLNGSDAFAQSRKAKPKAAPTPAPAEKVLESVEPPVVTVDPSTPAGQLANPEIVTEPATKPILKDIDQEITNPKLRAETGAKRKISLQSALSYSGSSLRTPFSSVRPQLSRGQVPPDVTKLTGNVSAKYRMSDYDNLNLGVGVGWTTPFSDGQRGQVENPFLQYGRVMEAWGLQHSFAAILTKYTARQLTDIADLDWGAEISHTVIKQFNNLYVGGVLAYDRQFYSESDQGRNQRLDGLALFPFMEYTFDKTFQFRTVYWGLRYYNTRTASSTIQHDDLGQSAGIGIVVSRDVYLYPNIQWIWEDMRSDKTNIALNANVNF